jgi:hypothetical protein
MIQPLAKGAFERLEKNLNLVEEVFCHMPSLSNVSRGEDEESAGDSRSGRLHFRG